MSLNTLGAALAPVLAVALLCGQCAKAGGGQHKEKVMEDNALRLGAAELECSVGELEAQPVETEFFRKWRFWRVSDRTLPPHVLFVATDAAGALRPKSERGFGELVASEPVTLRDADQAVRYVRFFLFVTEPEAEIVETIDDIPGVTDAERSRWGATIKPPRVREQDSSFEVEAWLWSGALLRADFLIGRGGRIEQRREVVAPKVGVKITIE
jgi:hypothetical protein